MHLSTVCLFQEGGVLYLLTNTEPIFEELEGHQVVLQTMQSSSAAGSFLDEVVLHSALLHIQTEQPLTI